MGCSYAENKKSIYTWREKNREKYASYRAKYRKQKAIWVKISIEFRYILIDE